MPPLLQSAGIGGDVECSLCHVVDLTVGMGATTLTIADSCIEIRRENAGENAYHITEQESGYSERKRLIQRGIIGNRNQIHLGS